MSVPSPRLPTNARQTKREENVPYSLPLYNRPCFFWGHCLKLKMCEVTLIKILLCPEGSCYGHVNLGFARKMVVI